VPQTPRVLRVSGVSDDERAIAARIERVGVVDLPVLMPMLRAYCDFYEVDPRDDRLIALSRALIEDPSQGEQLIARDDGGTPLGFATIYWTWQTLDAARIGVLNDLYVVPATRGSGVGRALIEHCRGLCRKRGAAKLVWETAPDNATAQRLYDGIGAESSTWLIYEMDAW
jgi:ribosomal protein S18 acetylase RimI-like enzyme